MGYFRNAIITVVSVLFVTGSAASGTRTELPNDINIELLGRCVIYSFSYQRIVSENFGIEVGASLLGGSGGSIAFISGGGRLYFLPGNASPCVSGGVVVLTASTGSGPFSKDNSASFGYIGPGFEYRSPGGFLLRGTVYFLIRDGFFVWPGIQLGIAF